MNSWFGLGGNEGTVLLEVTGLGDVLEARREGVWEEKC